MANLENTGRLRTMGACWLLWLGGSFIQSGYAFGVAPLSTRTALGRVFVTGGLSRTQTTHRKASAGEESLVNGSGAVTTTEDELEQVAEEILLPPKADMPGNLGVDEDDEEKSANGDSSEPRESDFVGEVQVDEYELLLNEHVDGSDSERTGDLPEALMKLPRHSTNEGVNKILETTESTIRALHKHSNKIKEREQFEAAQKAGQGHEAVFANSYVDLGKVDVIGFDFDYTLVTYTEELLELIYDMALRRLVMDRQYPMEMLEAGMKFDPFFSIRGLAVDKETGWITHLSYTHKVAVAWEGREKLPTSRILEEYRGKRALRPSERRSRLKPLNDLFSMAESCLIADTIQFFKDRSIPYYPQNVVTDVLKCVTETHLSGDFHRLVAKDPERYFNPTPHLKMVLTKLKESGKRLIFASNSPFWYVDAGMRYVFGPGWQSEWDAIITSAGKPNFYTDEARPFREVCQETRRLMFKRVERFEVGKVYTEGCLKELVRLMDWKQPSTSDMDGNFMSPMSVAAANVLYIGDSLFADLVDAKREFGWTTAAVTPEVGYERELKSQADYILTERTNSLLLNALRSVQTELGAGMRSEEDTMILDSLEHLVSLWRDHETALLGSPFGSVFTARYQPSLFASSLRRYCDLYMTSVSSLRHYSPQHRFYPEGDGRLLAHEITEQDPMCWDLDEVLERQKDE